MVNRGKNHLGIDRSKTGGGRKRRHAKEKQRKLRRQNLYKISVRSSVANEVDNGAVYGVYKKNSTTWILTAMAVRRTRTKMVSDKRGGTDSEIVGEYVVTQNYDGYIDPKEGLKIGSFNTKKEALKEASANKSKKVKKGEYLVRPNQWSRSMDLYKVDRDKYREFTRKRAVRRMK